MKKYIAMLLVCVLCLSMSACASEVQKTVEEANSLVTSGKYEEAKNLLSSIEEYQMVNDALVKITLEESEGLVKEKNFEEAISLLKGLPQTDIVLEKISEAEEGKAAAEQAEYEAMNQEILITMDNWDEYFELTEGCDTYVDQFDVWIGIYPGYLVKLKDEFLDSYVSSEVDFQLSEDAICFDYTWEEGTKNYTISNKTIEDADMINSETVYDRRDYHEKNSDLYGTISAFWGSPGVVGPSGYTMAYENAEVINAQGTLVLHVEK